MKDYVIAVPSYNRTEEITQKTLKTLKSGKVDPKKVHVFVANKDEEKKYKEAMNPSEYGKIVVGVKGIQNQRKYISKYFPVGQYIVSLDDDVEGLFKLNKKGGVDKMNNLDKFFKEAYSLMKKKGINLWGVYPVQNPFFMSDKITFDLRFIIGVIHGYINHHDNSLYPKAVVKEDYETSILFYKRDGGIIRYNNITFKTKFNAPGGLGTDKDGKRFKMNKEAAEYLEKKYPKYVRRQDRKNGMPEIRLIANPDKDEDVSDKKKTNNNKTRKKSTKIKSKKNKSIKNKSTKKKTRSNIARLLGL